MTTRTVLIADDQPLIREGLRRVLETDPALRVCGQATDGREAVDRAISLSPDVVLMDIRMPIVNGIEATEQLFERGFDGNVIVLTTFGLDDYVLDALRAGASGFVLKESPPQRIIDAIHAVANGDALIDPAVTRTVIGQIGRKRFARSTAGPFDPLTARESEVLALLARGYSNAEIAQTLVVGEGTVKTHVAHILTKLGVRDRLQAVIYAYESGLA
jgi:DNA-binding NarL/FixJ family response regulator